MVNMGELFAYPRLRNVPMDRVPLNRAEAQRFILNEGDLLFARQSLVLEGAGKCSIFLNDDEPVTFESHVTRVRLDARQANPRFYYYYLQSHHGRAAIRSIVEQGAGASGIRGSDLAMLEVGWVPVVEQRAIAHILGTLDDKIELNRRMNETLEGIARALFKSWFVDFDPVWAKAEGRDTGLPRAVADLFPGGFERSELGEIPEGWPLVSFAEQVQIIGGGTPKTSVPEYWDGEVPWFSVVDAPSDSDVFVIDTEKKITPAGVDNSATRVLAPGTVIITARGTVGRVALLGVPMAMNQSCYGLRGWVGRGTHTYFATRALVSTLRHRTHGSVFETITRDTLAGVQVVRPTEEIVRAFEKLAAPFMDRLLSNLKDSRTLAALRDTLLPKLLSGEIRVKGAERLVEEVA